MIALIYCWKETEGPPVEVGIAIYPNIAVTGQRTLPVAPRCRVEPIPKGSALNLYRCTARFVGVL